MSFLTAVVLYFRGCKFSRERSNSIRVVWLMQPCAFGYHFFKFMRCWFELTGHPVICDHVYQWHARFFRSLLNSLHAGHCSSVSLHGSYGADHIQILNWENMAIQIFVHKKINEYESPKFPVSSTSSFPYQNFWYIPVSTSLFVWY